MSKKMLFGLLGIVGGGIVLYAVVASDIFPAAIVGSDVISTGEHTKQFVAAKQYYEAAAQANKVKLEPASFVAELRRASLDKLIENRLIQTEVRRAYPDAEAAAQQRVVVALPENDTNRTALKKIYGLSVPDFRRMVLLPEARREFLVQKMGGTEAAALIARLKKAARVMIFSPKFSWTGSEVKAGK